MTTRQRKWHEIAEAYMRQPSKRTKIQRSLTVDGLCKSADLLNMPYNKVYLFVMDIDQDDRYGGDYFCPPRCHADQRTISSGWTRQCDYERSIFAGLMAALSDKDYEEMMKCGMK